MSIRLNFLDHSRQHLASQGAPLEKLNIHAVRHRYVPLTSARRTSEAIREFLYQQHRDEEPAPMIANGMFKPRPPEARA